jgi:hypothetical protein
LMPATASGAAPKQLSVEPLIIVCQPCVVSAMLAAECLPLHNMDTSVCCPCEGLLQPPMPVRCRQIALAQPLPVDPAFSDMLCCWYFVHSTGSGWQECWVTCATLRREAPVEYHRIRWWPCARRVTGILNNLGGDRPSMRVSWLRAHHAA